MRNAWRQETVSKGKRVPAVVSEHRSALSAFGASSVATTVRER
jgi:hypothetical protein